jgi:hypothetical protein
MLQGDEPQRGLPGAVACDRDAAGGGGVAGCEHRLVEHERGRRVLVHLGIERAPMRSQDALDAFGGAASDVGNLGVRRCRQSMKDERAALGTANVDAIEREDVFMHIQPQGAVRPLDGSDGSGMRIRHAAQAEDRLASTLERAAELADEGAHDFGAQRRS